MHESGGDRRAEGISEAGKYVLTSSIAPRHEATHHKGYEATHYRVGTA